MMYFKYSKPTLFFQTQAFNFIFKHAIIFKKKKKMVTNNIFSGSIRIKNTIIKFTIYFEHVGIIKMVNSLTYQ